jgi:hypothetical protein
MDIAIYPGKVPWGHTGCQRVWYGERQRPEAMQVLATYQFENGRDVAIDRGQCGEALSAEGVLAPRLQNSNAEVPTIDQIAKLRAGAHRTCTRVEQGSPSLQSSAIFFWRFRVEALNVCVRFVAVLPS